MNDLPHPQDLSRLDGPVLIFGGPYSNLAATRAMRRRAAELDIPPRRVICTGDVVAYCGEPRETVQMVRDWGIAVVRGNCEESLADAAPDCGCGFVEGTLCSALAVDWYNFANARLVEDERAWMRDLPRALHFELNDRSILVVHAGVDSLNRFIFPATPAEVKQRELQLSGSDILIGGHSGIPSAQRFGMRAWLNAGAIGIPANDGTRDGWYLLLVPEGERIRCQWQRLTYDPAPSIAAMRAAGLTAGYAKALESGLWPSLDVLPPQDRARRGIPIVLKDLVL